MFIVIGVAIVGNVRQVSNIISIHHLSVFSVVVFCFFLQFAYCVCFAASLSTSFSQPIQLSRWLFTNVSPNPRFLKKLVLTNACEATKIYISNIVPNQTTHLAM